jgi:pyruvate,orthophosphate dikinase
MQVKAILKAACNLTKRGIKVIPEIEIPLVGHELELKTLERLWKKQPIKFLQKREQR